MSRKYLVVTFILLFIAAGLTFADDFNPTAGNTWTYTYQGQPMTLKVSAYSPKVNGYSVLRMLNLQDTYGGGSYFARIAGQGVCDIGTDVHDAFSGEFEGIAIYYPPKPNMGTLAYGDAVGTVRQWSGYTQIDPEDYVEMYDKDVWEVLGYEDITVPYGTFVNAMKVLHKNYYASVYDEGEIPAEDDWEFSPSCSEYIWWVPCVGVVQFADYEDESSVVQLASCKLSCTVVADPTPAELSLALNDRVLPSSVLCGAPASISLEAQVRNIDSKACPAGTTVDIVFFLEEIDTHNKIRIGELLNCSVSKLAAGGSKNFLAKLTLPAALEAGNYCCTAEMGDDTAVLSEHVLAVQPSFISLVMQLVKPNLPSAVIAGTAVKADVALNIVNQGNIATPKTQVVSLAVYARPVLGGSDILMNTIQYPVGNLGPSKIKKIKLPVVFKADVPEGEYKVVIRLDGSELVIESPVTIAAPFVSLKMVLLESNLPKSVIAGTAVKADVTINILNEGNIPTSKTEVAAIDIVLRSIDDASISFTKSLFYAIGNLAPSKKKSLKIPMTFPSTAPQGTYTVEFHLKGSVLSMNNKPITISPPFIQLEAASVISNLPAGVIAGTSTKGDIQLAISNQGNIPTSKTATITVGVTARPAAGEDVVLLSTQYSIGNLVPSKSKTIKLPVTFGLTVPKGSYSILVVMDGIEYAAGNVVVSPPPADLVLVSSAVPAKIYGYKRFNVSDTVQNNGGALNTSTTIEYYLSLDKTVSGDDDLLGERTVPALAAGMSSSGSTRLSTWNMINPFDIPIPYYILVVVDTYNQADEGKGEANNIKVYSVKFMPGEP